VITRRGPELPYKLVAGVTPSAGQWLLASAKVSGATFAPEEPRLIATFSLVLDERPTFDAILINAPIGYPSGVDLGFRTCDREARELLGSRGNVITAVPGRRVFEKANISVEGLDAVTQVLMPRYRNVASEMSPFRQRQVYEGHPELSFFQLNGGVPMQHQRFREAGREERRQLLISKLNGIERVLNIEIEGVKPHQLIDAAVLVWSARRAFTHTARRLPYDPEWDSEGLRMEYIM
jgi:predicted RNase H-like nuclease